MNAAELMSELKLKMEEEKENILSSIKFKKGDTVSWMNTKDNKREVGRILYIYVSDDGIVNIEIQRNRMIRLGWSDSKVYCKNPADLELVKIDKEEFNALLNDISAVDQQIRSLQEERRKYVLKMSNVCIHDWDFDAPMADPPDDIKYYCKLCGLAGID